METCDGWWMFTSHVLDLAPTALRLRRLVELQSRSELCAQQDILESSAVQPEARL